MQEEWGGGMGVCRGKVPVELPWNFHKTTDDDWHQHLNGRLSFT